MSNVEVDNAAIPIGDDDYDYIFGFGSIMNTSTHATWHSSPSAPNTSTDASSSDKITISCTSSTIPGVVAIIKSSFGYKRTWNFRSSTGFTALGVVKISDDDDDDDGQRNNEENCQGINGVLFKVLKSEIPNFDVREAGYTKMRVPIEYLEFPSPHDSSNTTNATFPLYSGTNVWLYVPLPSQTMIADENHPLLQSYVDTVLQGCLEWGGEAMAEQFIISTEGWSTYYLNDTPSSRRPWLFRKQYATIDALLSKYSELTNYGDRRHPEEFASAFNQRMRGTWSIPRRNPNFTGRDCELEELQAKFTSQEMGSSSLGRRRQQHSSGVVVKVEVTGMGGVGKTQLVTEFCYRHFPQDYGLVVWVNAETVDTLITDYRQLLSDLANVEPDMDKSSTEIVDEVRTRLFRSNVPWLLVFDNIEDHSLLERFVPRGAGSKGHVLVTTRHVDAESRVDSSGTLSLGCLHTMEAIELLRRSAGSHNMAGSNLDAARVLCEKLGNLPLALSMAATYMRQCEVECCEYLDRYTASEMSGETLLRRGKLPDYSLTVASSLSLILPKIKETNETTLEVLHLLSYLGPDAITKLLLRNLLSAKKKFDDEHAEEERHEAASKSRRFGQNTVVGGLILGGVTLVCASTLMLPATRSQRTCVVIALSAASSFFVLSRVSAFVPGSIPSLAEQTTSCASSSFSAFEYDQSDDAWDILKSFSLLSVKDGKGSVHRLLQQAMRSCHSKEETLYYITICVDAMLSCWTFKPNSTESWKSSLQLLEHVKVIVAHCKEYDVDANRLLKIAQLSKEAGVLSAMALNAFVEAEASLELSLEFLERSSTAKKLEVMKAKAESQYELSKIHRYQGRYDDANKRLVVSLELNCTDDCLTADTLHELGILEVKKHNLDTATKYLQQSLEIRRGLNDANDQGNASSTLHQLAAIHIARKPPSLEMATSLLREALGLSRQIGQRAATIKQLARVTVRQGFLDQAESYLEQALELYLELYGNKMHINIAAVKFQMGALALQRNMLDNAWLCFHECLRIRRHVYAYACPEGNSTENAYPIHFEVSCVLHELGCVGLAQKRFTQSMNMLEAERVILERLAEASTQNERIYQARLTNLTWLRKCAKEMGDESRTTFFSTERFHLKHHEGHQFREETHHELSKTAVLQGKALQCRQLARKFALEKSISNSTCRDELVSCLNELQEETRRVEPGPMTDATLKFHETLFLWLDKPGRRSPILSACDSLRDVLRSHGIQVNDTSCTSVTR